MALGLAGLCCDDGLELKDGASLWILLFEG